MWWFVGQASVAVAGGVGIGRFVYTPILPMMATQAGLTPQWGAGLATANYVGYLVGSVAAIAVPALARSRPALRGSLVVLVASMLAMPATTSVPAWVVLRVVGGAGSALIFVIAADALLRGLRGPRAHLVGWGLGGAGGGIALSGAMVLLIRASGTWQTAWIYAAVLATACAVVSWWMPIPPEHTEPADTASVSSPHSRWFRFLLLSYTLEGVGYIIAGTFLVAAVDRDGPVWLGAGVWILVGLGAALSPVVWAKVATIWTRPTLLLVALLVQAVGILLPVVVTGTVAALGAATLFGGTFIAIAMLTVAIGSHLRVNRSVAILTTGYSVGQILGPLVVAPILTSGYKPALLVGSAIVVLSASAAAVVRPGFPHHLGPLPRRLAPSTSRIGTRG